MGTYLKSVLFIIFIFHLPSMAEGDDAKWPESDPRPVIFSMDDLFYSTAPSPAESSARWHPISQFDLKSLPLDRDPDRNGFWVRIRLPAQKFDTPTLYFSAFLEGFEIWRSGIRCYEHTPDDTPGFRYFDSHMIPLPVIDNANDFLIRIRYSTRISIGDIYMVALGSETDIVRLLAEDKESVFKGGVKDLLLGFLLIVLGFLSFFVFLIRIKNRDYPFLSFGFFAFCAGMKYLATLKSLHLINISPVGSHFLENIFFLLVPVGLFAFTDHIFGTESKKTIRTLWQAHLVFAVIATLLIWTNRMYDPLILILFFISSLVSLCHILTTGKKFGAKIRMPFIVFFLMLIILLINELLKTCHFPFLPVDLFGWGLLALVFALVYVLIEQYTKTYVRMRQISLDLEKKRYELLKLEQTNLLTQFEALKNQLNPHFLFNNFSTLVSLIEEDTALAVSYVQELTKVYRYMLKTKVKDLVRIRDEIAFVNSYAFLLSKRFESNLNLSVDIPQSHMEDLVLPFCIQLLVENAIKHNIISSKKMLSVHIAIDGDWLVVTNTRQPKNGQKESTGIGLPNLIKRYRFFTERNVEIISNDSHFMVKLPLIKQMEHAE